MRLSGWLWESVKVSRLRRGARVARSAPRGPAAGGGAVGRGGGPLQCGIQAGRATGREARVGLWTPEEAGSQALGAGLRV